jgi:hypothetical protein
MSMDRCESPGGGAPGAGALSRPPRCARWRRRGRRPWRARRAATDQDRRLCGPRVQGQPGRPDHDPDRHDADGDERVRLGGASRRDAHEEDGQQHSHVREEAEGRDQDVLERGSLRPGPERDHYQEVRHAVDQERADIRCEDDLEEVVRAEDPVRAEDTRDHRQHEDPEVRRGVPAMQQPQEARDLAVAAHDVGDPDAGVQAGEGRPDQRDEDRRGQDQGEDRAGPAEHRVADELDQVADRRPGCRRRAVARNGSGLAGRIRDRPGERAADREVRGHVLDEVGEEALDREREQDRAPHVAFRVVRLGAERGHRLEADQEQDCDRALEEDVRQVMRQHDGEHVLVGVGELGVAEPEDHGEDAEGQQRGELDDVDHDGGERRAGDPAEGDQPGERGEHRDERDLERRLERDPEQAEDVDGQDPGELCASRYVRDTGPGRGVRRIGSGE